MFKKQAHAAVPLRYSLYRGSAIEGEEAKEEEEAAEGGEGDGVADHPCALATSLLLAQQDQRRH
jgi:hypothetical protein